MNDQGIPCSWMRGGTSKGVYFLAADLPANQKARDELLLSIMGSPDLRQIDGLGGADPLTSKVAIVGPATRADADIDYLFLQVAVDQPLVSDQQNCGNLLAGVGQFAIERGLLAATSPKTRVKVHLLISRQLATVTLETPDGVPRYSGDTTIAGVPGTAAAVLQNFPEAAGATCGSLLPSGESLNRIAGVDATLIDNGMPVVIVPAADFLDCGVIGYESREQLEANDALRHKLEKIRLLAGPMMQLGDVTDKTVPKMTLVAAPRGGGSITTRTFIPHRCHASIGVLGAVSVATAVVIPGSVAHRVADHAIISNAEEDASDRSRQIVVEHPLGELGIVVDTDASDGRVDVRSASVVRTARKLFEGKVFAKAPDVTV